MLSDNAPTYLAAAEELKQLFQSPSLKESLSRQGFWERLLGLSKLAIKKTLGRPLITVTDLQTLAVEVEFILNDRPITYVSGDVVDEEPLTPSHLLYGRRITPLPYPEIEDEVTDPTFGNDFDLTKELTSKH